MKRQIETEHKYIIKMPDLNLISAMQDYTADEITQIYLPSEEGVTHRIRMRRGKDKTAYTETKKIRLNKISSIEEEGEISEERFLTLEKNILPGTRAVRKTRHTFNYRGQIFEIDIYPEWKRSAIMEAEVGDPEQTFEIPECIEIIEEVTGQRSYSNAAMARSFPEEKEL